MTFTLFTSSFRPKSSGFSEVFFLWDGRGAEGQEWACWRRAVHELRERMDDDEFEPEFHDAVLAALDQLSDIVTSQVGTDRGIQD